MKNMMLQLNSTFQTEFIFKQWPATKKRRRRLNLTFFVLLSYWVELIYHQFCLSYGFVRRTRIRPSFLWIAVNQFQKVNLSVRLLEISHRSRNTSLNTLCFSHFPSSFVFGDSFVWFIVIRRDCVCLISCHQVVSRW